MPKQIQNLAPAPEGKVYGIGLEYDQDPMQGTNFVFELVNGKIQEIARFSVLGYSNFFLNLEGTVAHILASDQDNKKSLVKIPLVPGETQSTDLTTISSQIDERFQIQNMVATNDDLMYGIGILYYGEPSPNTAYTNIIFKYDTKTSIATEIKRAKFDGYNNFSVNPEGTKLYLVHSKHEGETELVVVPLELEIERIPLGE